MNDTELIKVILELADELSGITARGRDAFDQDVVTKRACERVVEIIGDLVGQFSEEFREAHPEVRYRGAKGIRNVMAHQYLMVDSKRLWEAATLSVPQTAVS